MNKHLGFTPRETHFVSPGIALVQRLSIMVKGRRRLSSFMAGAVMALAMPPFGFWPIILISFPVAVWLLDSVAEDHRSGRVGFWQSLRQAGGLGWWFGFGYFLAGLWWLGSAFLVDADEFLWALPLGVMGLPMMLALFTAVGFMLARLLWQRGPVRILAFTASLTLIEWLRGNILTGFPWNAYGMAFGQDLVLAQGASIGGLWLLTLLAVLVGAAPATLADDTPINSGSMRRWGMTLLGCLVLAGLAGYGLWRIPTAPMPAVEGVRLRVMQPNISEEERATEAFRTEVLSRYSALSNSTGPDGHELSEITHLIWPESAFPFLVDRSPQALEAIRFMLPPETTLITGAARAEDQLPGENGYRFFNAIRVYDATGRTLQTYDKVHLVPFGEYLPLEDWLRRVGLRQFVHTPGGFQPGLAREALEVRGLPAISPLICYEAIFPDEARIPGPSAGLILNLTNDAWFGLTPGPHQHFAQSRLRAIEQGLPLVRAANTGISAVIDPYGRPIAMLPLDNAGVIDSVLPRKIQGTYYLTGHGNKIWIAISFVFLLISIFSLKIFCIKNDK